MQLFHITTIKDWENGQKVGHYRPKSLEDVGFIHCSLKEQVLPTLNRRFKGHKDLLLVELDSTKIAAEVKLENVNGIGEKHPHIFGEFPLDAVVKTEKLVPNEDGGY